MKKSEVARLLGVSLSSVKRYLRKFRQGRSLSPRKAPGKRPKVDERARRMLEADLKKRPFAKLHQRCDYLEALTALRVRRSTLCRTLKRMGFTKKRAVSASERDAWLRAAWKVTVAGVLDPRRLVFVDECGTHVSLAPIYGCSPKGERVRLKVPRNRGKNTTLLASMSLEGMGPSLAIEGTTTKEVFKAYVDYFLAPALKNGQVVVMDNLSAHKGDRVRELIERQGCEL